MSEQADSFAPQNAEHANVSAFTRREKEPQAWKRNAHANAWAIVSVALRRRSRGDAIRKERSDGKAGLTSSDLHA